LSELGYYLKVDKPFTQYQHPSQPEKKIQAKVEKEVVTVAGESDTHARAPY
jgi:hypothetical protein